LRTRSKIRVGITIGDPAGIGPAIAAKAVHALKGTAEFVVIGDAWVFGKVTKSQSQHPAISDWPVRACARKVTGPRFIDLKNVSQKEFKFGKMKAEYGRASLEYLDKALELIRAGEIDCLVTCPVSKEAINKAGYRFSGHTEYLAEKTSCQETVMMLLNSRLRFSLVTRHIPLAAVSRQLNSQKLRTVIRMTACALKEIFSVRIPRIVVCGLNPHASDGGCFGREEQEVIRPVVRSMKKKTGGLEGPIPADTAIARAYSRLYDAVIAMYHDQALIPLKLSGDPGGVNLTLGLPFIRTSPLHGTAFDIAKHPRQADPRSLIAAIHWAIRCASNQKNG
jgi:4-hydroxythreonine-4-phosphate dehydrogenase